MTHRILLWRLFNKFHTMDHIVGWFIMLLQLVSPCGTTKTGNCHGCLICPTELPNYLTASDIGDTSAVKDLNLNNCSIANMELRVFRNNKVMKVLRFSRNSLRNISQGYFTDLISLEQLYVDNGEVEYIDEDAFAETQPLEVISLTHNRLQAFHEKAFHGIPNLTYLDLRYNKLTVLSNKSFAGLASLKYLRLGNNKLHSVHTGYEWPPKLAWLDLENNKFDLLPPLASCGFKLTFLGNPLYCGCVREDPFLPNCKVQLGCKFPREKSYIRSTGSVNYTNYKPNVSLKIIRGFSMEKQKWETFTGVTDCYPPEIVNMTQLKDKVICLAKSDPPSSIKLVSQNVNKRTVQDGTNYGKKETKLSVALHRGDKNVTCEATNTLGEAKRYVMVVPSRVTFPVKETTLQLKVTDPEKTDAPTFAVTLATAVATASGITGTVITVAVPATLFLVIMSGLVCGYLCYKRRARKDSNDHSNRPLPQKPPNSRDSCLHGIGRDSKTLSVMSNHLYEDVKEISKYEALLPPRAQYDYIKATNLHGTTLKPPVIDPTTEGFGDKKKSENDDNRPESYLKLDSSGCTLRNAGTNLETKTLDSLGTTNRATSDYVRPDSYVKPESYLEPIQMIQFSVKHKKINKEPKPNQS